MTPSRASVGLSVPSLTLSAASPSLAPPALDEGWGGGEVDITAEGKEREREMEVGDSIDEDDISDDGEGWRTVNPLAGATQFDFDDSQLPPAYEEGEEEEEAEELRPPSVVAAAPSTLSLHPQQPPLSLDEVVEVALPRPTPAMASPSHFHSLPSNLPSGPLPLHSTTPSPPAESLSAVAVVPSPALAEVTSLPDLHQVEVPYVAESPIAHSPDVTATPPSQPSLTSHPSSPSAHLISPPLPLSLPRQSSFQSSAVELSPPHSIPLEEGLSSTPFGPASLHPSLPALEPGTLAEEEEEEGGVRTEEVMEIELDDSLLSHNTRPSDTPLSVRGGESITAQRDSRTMRSSSSLPSSLGKRRAGAASTVLSPPRPVPSASTGRPAVFSASGASIRPPSPVTASQLLTDSQVSEMVESQTFDGTLYQFTTSTLSFIQYPLQSTAPPQCDPPHTERSLPPSPQADDDNDGSSEEDNSVVFSPSPQQGGPEVGPHSSHHSQMEVELDSDVDAILCEDEEGEEGANAEVAVAAVSLVKEEREVEEEDVGDSLDGAFDLRSRLTAPESRPSPAPLLLSPTFTATPSSPEMFSPPRPTRLSPLLPQSVIGEERREEEGREGLSTSPRIRRRLQGPGNGHSPSQKERKSKSGTAEAEQHSVAPADEKEGSEMEERRKARNAKGRGHGGKGDVRRKSRNGRVQATANPSPPRQGFERKERDSEKEEGEEKVEGDKGHSTVDDDDVFVSPVGRSTALGPSERGISSAFLCSSSKNGPPLNPLTAKLTARERTQRRIAPPQQKSLRGPQLPKGDIENAGVEVEEPSRAKKRRKKSSRETSASTSAPHCPSSSLGRSGGRSSEGRLKQTSLSDFSFSSAPSVPICEEDLFVRPTVLSSSNLPGPALHRSTTRQPLSDVSNTAAVASPSGKGRWKEGEGTPWQLKKKKSGLPSLRDEGPPFSNSFDRLGGGGPVKPTRATASAAAIASALSRGGGNRRGRNLSSTSRGSSSTDSAVEAPINPSRFDGEVNLLSSQEG